MPSFQEEYTTGFSTSWFERETQKSERISPNDKTRQNAQCRQIANEYCEI